MTDWDGTCKEWQQRGRWRTQRIGSSAAGGMKVWPEEAWQWGEYITLQDSAMRVSLSGAGIGDADLEPLTRHLDAVLEQYIGLGGLEYSVTIDLSCNWGISDYGITVHLIPFLRKWPACRRLKLYQTSIGDRALTALSPWVAEGYVHEIHMSDLGGVVTGDAVLDFLREIHRKGNYPYWDKGGGHAALWLRLEHNRIQRADEVVARGRAEGMSLRVLGKADLSTVRPGASARGKARKSPAVNLVLFRIQQSKAHLPDAGLNCGRALLEMLRAGERPVAKGPGVVWQEPQPLSLDEFRLWEMEAREDMELGANVWNKETFGEDVATGWSFEENLAANERIASQAWTQEPFGVCEFMPWQNPDQRFSPLLDFGGRPDEVASAATTVSVPPWARTEAVEGSSFEADSASICSSTARSKHQHMARCEVEEEIYNALARNPMLHRLDFDGRVRQYLHAIRTVGGQHKVREAMDIVHEAMSGKTRSCVQRWPAYLVALLKKYLKENAGRHLHDAQ